MEKTIWLKPKQEVEYCPNCRSVDIRPTEVHGLWTCQECGNDFIVRHREPELQPRAKAISPDELLTWTEKIRSRYGACA